MPDTLTTLLSIGGSDPCGGAGIQTDIRCGISLGLHVSTALTAVTVQNSKSLFSINAVEATLLEQQLNAIKADQNINAIKIGMIGSLDNGEVVSNFIKNLADDIPIVTDPVLTATVGGKLISGNINDILRMYTTSIFPYSTVITPNIEEAEQLMKYYGERIDINTKATAIRLLKNIDTNAIILKGGHEEKKDITDYLADNFDGVLIVSETTHSKIECTNLHGTGCAYSSLLASFLALGFSLPDAFIKTSNKIYEIISRSCEYSLENSTYGPLNINNYIF